MQNKKYTTEIFAITKRINNGMFMLKAENRLFGFDNPKIQFTIIQPANDNSGKYSNEKAFLDVQEVVNLIRNIQFYNPTAQNADVILKSFKGNFDKKLNMIVSRVFNVTRTNQQGKPTYVKFSIELVEGEQSFVLDKFGNKKPGVVKPKRGSKILNKGSIALNRDEVLYVASMLDKEIQAWRNALNMDYMTNPKKYQYNSNVTQTNPPFPSQQPSQTFTPSEPIPPEFPPPEFPPY